MRLNRLVALCLLFILMSFATISVFAQDTTEEPEATAEATAEATEEATAETTEEPDAPSGGSYVVQPGDNLFRIALRNGLTTRQLAEANNITNPALIFVGQRLVIPGDGSVVTPAPAETEEPATTETPDATATPTTPATTSSYTVQPGDSLYRIAVRNQTTVAELVRLNPGVANQNIIFVGQRLILPDGSTDADADDNDSSDAETPDEDGITIEVFTQSGVEVLLGADNINALVSQVQQLGVESVKLTVDWREVEAEEGVFAFDAIDQAISSFDAIGIDIFVTLIGSPEWATPSATDLAIAQNAMIPPEDFNDFGAFAGAVAARFAGVVDGYEIWSDPNLRINWMTPNVTLRPDGFPDARLAIEVRYIDLLEAAHTAIKAADADALVITAGLAPTGNDDFYNSIDTFVFFEALLSQGALNFSDAIGVHIDGFANAPDADCCGTLEDGIPFNESYHFFFNIMLENYREILDRNGGDDVPLMITRVGWGTAENADTAPQQESSYLADNTASEQAQFVVDAFEIATQRADVSNMIIYNLNGCSFVGSTACYYSIIGADGAARPIFAAIQAIPSNLPDVTGDPEPAPEATEEASGG